MNWYKKSQTDITSLLNEMRVAHPNLTIRAKELDDRIILEYIGFPEEERREGRGSKIIKELQNYASNKRKFIILHPTADTSFYEQLGFARTPLEKRYNPNSVLFSPAAEYWYWSMYELV